MATDLILEIEKFTTAMTVEDVARLLNVEKSTILRLAKRGVIPSFRVSQCVRFNPSDVAAYISKATKKANR
jgi:excisionase family DNA binding protein